MGRKPKSAEVRAKFFTARASGATLKQAVAAAGVSKTTGHYWLTQSGGVRPRVRRPQSPLRLSLEERETISRGLAQKKTLTAIAGELGRSVSTVSREVARNSGPNGYRAARADRLAVLRTSRPRPGKLADDPILRRYVEDSVAVDINRLIDACEDLVDDDLSHARGAYRFQATEQRVVRSYAAAVTKGLRPTAAYAAPTVRWTLSNCAWLAGWSLTPFG